MRTRGIIAYALMLSFLLIGCSKEKPFNIKDENILQIDELPADFVVPEVIWDSMKSSDAVTGGEGEGEGGHSAKSEGKPIRYTTVNVFMKEKNKDVLKKPLLGFAFTRGGGDLDLSAVMGDKSGTFYLGFEFPEFENVTQKKAFFISESRRRKVDGEILGSGCRKVLDISKEFFKENSEMGIKINTTRDRQDSILGGHLIIIGETDKNWLLTQVTFYDSKRMELFCKGFRSSFEGNH